MKSPLPAIANVMRALAQVRIVREKIEHGRWMEQDSILTDIDQQLVEAQRALVKAADLFHAMPRAR